MEPVSTPTPERYSSRQVQLVVVLALGLVAVLVFRYRSANQKPNVPTAVTPSSPSLNQTSTASVTESEQATKFDPGSLAVNLDHLWTANPFHRITSHDERDSGRTVESSANSVNSDGTANSASSADPPTEDLLVHSGEGDMRVSAIFDNGREMAAIIGSKIRRQGDYVNETLQIVAIHKNRVEVAQRPDASVAPTDQQ